MLKFTKVCSILLTMVMLFNLVPVQAFAATDAIDTATSDAVVSKVPAAETVAAATIVQEIEENRTEYSKEFKLSNGLSMAVVYGTPVHYAKDGKWAEIDNTLKAAGDVYTNTAGVWEVALPQNFNMDSPVSITKDGHTLSFALTGQLTAPVGTATKAVAKEQTLSVTTAQTATAQLRDFGVAAAKAEAEHPETVSEKLCSGLMYEDVFAGTALTYDLDSNKVKESLIIEEYNADLRGYEYTLNTGDLVPVLTEEGQIEFYNKEKTQVVMTMPAPFLVDAANTYNYDVQVQLTGADGTYTLTYLLPQLWLADSSRQWPVVLDPVVDATNTAGNIQDRKIAERATAAYDSDYMEVGYDDENGIERVLIQYNTLPEMRSSDVIIYAQIALEKISNAYISSVIEAHQVTGPWTDETVTWQTQPAFNSLVEDYLVVEDAGTYTWEITNIVRSWYEEGNHGLLLKASDEIETGGTENRKQFYSSDCGGSSLVPALTIVYTNQNGVEGYWSYTPASAGWAGTGYVNNYTGNLTWVHSDIGFGGNRQPVSISHAYNTYDTGNEGRYGTGTGWKTSMNQRIYPLTDDVNSDYMIWEDGDGTAHYLKKEDKGYVDEGDPSIVFNYREHGTATDFSVIEIGNGTRYHFDNQRRLTKIEDYQYNPNSIRISYVANLSYKIATVTDGAGRLYTYHYNTDGLLDYISYTGSGTEEIARVSFTYTDSRLTGVTGIDGKQTSFTYENGLLKTAAEMKNGTPGLNITYTYSDDGFNRVTGIAQKDGTTAGGQMEIDYNYNQTTLWDKVNNIKQVTRFNDFGNVITVQDELGRAQHAGYTKMSKDDAGAGNQLLLSSKLQNTVKNYFADHSFEGYSEGGSGAVYFTDDEAYMGNMSISTTSTVSTRPFSLPAGESFTLSAWVKTGNTTAKLTLGDQESATIKANTDWTRLEVTYTNHTETAQNVKPTMVTGNDSNRAYMDCVQLEKMKAASRYNLLEDSDGTSNSKWTGSDYTVETVTAAAPQLDGKAYKLTGDPEAEKRFSQTLTLSGEKGDCFVLAGWAKGSSVPLHGDRSFGMELTFNYTADVEDPKEQKVSFNPDTDGGWQYAAGAIVAEEAYDSVTVTVSYDYNANTAWFDGIQLFKETYANSYTYDENGNVVSTTDLQQQKTTYEYTNNDLTKVVLPSGAEMTYTYDVFHNVKTATSAEGLHYSFTYDYYGNNTKVSTTSGGKTISSSATYTADGNYLATVTNDALNTTTTYGYNLQTGVLEWVKGPKDTDATRTEYTYNPDTFLLEEVSAAVGDQTMWAEYTYDDGLLTGLATPTTVYSFDYGAFNLRQSVKIGGRTLISYSYTPNNYLLSRMTYGNNDFVEYDYDAYGRVLSETYEDGDVVTYHYDNDGALVAVTDEAAQITTRQYFDLSGRNVGYSEIGTDFTHRVGYTYNTDNNLSEQVENINGTETVSSYQYDEDNRVTELTTDGVTVVYTYDGFGRVSQQVTKTTENGQEKILLTEVFTFNDPQTLASSQVQSYKTYKGTVSDENLRAEYHYTYDENGNITSVFNGSTWIYYTYDSANQLIREDNQRTNRTYTWTYDNAGNILDFNTYIYTRGAVGEALSAIGYGYDKKENEADEEYWGDLLISLDGQNVSYEYQQATEVLQEDGTTKTCYNIGNPTQLNGRTYTWEHGRRLATMTKGSVQWTYTYNNAGLRTSRSNGSTTYKYIYDGSLLKRMTIIDSDGTEHVDFTYDAGGTPLTMTYQGSTYYYIVNLQGDVEGLLDADGNRVLTYYYTAYGQGKYLAGEHALTNTLININPLGYRGYIHDVGTGLYYCQSRYYDPVIGRFINADVYAATGQGLTGNNMFTYCLNNPVNLADYTGTSATAVAIVIIIVGVIVSGISEVVCDYIETGNMDGAVGNFIDGVLKEMVSAFGPMANSLVVSYEALNIYKECLEAGASLEDSVFATGVYVACQVLQNSFGEGTKRQIAGIICGFLLDIVATECKMAVINRLRKSENAAGAQPYTPISDGTPATSGRSVGPVIVGPCEPGIGRGQNPSYTGYGWSSSGKFHNNNNRIPTVTNIGWCA